MKLVELRLTKHLDEILFPNVAPGKLGLEQAGDARGARHQDKAGGVGVQSVGRTRGLGMIGCAQQVLQGVAEKPAPGVHGQWRRLVEHHQRFVLVQDFHPTIHVRFENRRKFVPVMITGSNHMVGRQRFMAAIEDSAARAFARPLGRRPMLNQATERLEQGRTIAFGGNSNGLKIVERLATRQRRHHPGNARVPALKACGEPGKGPTATTRTNLLWTRRGLQTCLPVTRIQQPGKALETSRLTIRLVEMSLPKGLLPPGDFVAQNSDDKFFERLMSQRPQDWIDVGQPGQGSYLLQQDGHRF